TRSLYQKARTAFTEGRLAEAYESFLAAREGANTYYTSLIDEQIRYLQPQLYASYLNIGGQFEAERKPVEAAKAYMRARAIDPRGRDAFEQLIDVSNANDPALRTVISEYRKLFQKEDARLDQLRKRATA